MYRAKIYSLLPHGLKHAGIVKVGGGHLRSLDGEALRGQSLPYRLLRVQVRPSGLGGAWEQLADLRKEMREGERERGIYRYIRREMAIRGTRNLGAPNWKSTFPKQAVPFLYIYFSTTIRPIGEREKSSIS